MKPEECASKWKNLWNKFVMEVKKIKGGESGMQGQYTPTWLLFPLMEFIGDTIKHRSVIIIALYIIIFVCSI